MSEITTLQRALLELLKIGIGTSDRIFDFSVLADDDWEKLIGESVLHAVHLMSFDAASKVKELIPVALKSKWMEVAVSTLSRNLFLLDAQQELINVLNEEHFEYIILKGTASASYYTDYEKRCFGDIDFLINPAQKDEVAEALEKKGYLCVLKDYVCHSVFEKNNVQYEMHYEIAGLPDGKIGELFRKYLENAEKRSYNNKFPEFKNPVPEIHAIILLLHTLHHLLDEGIGLRHLCDWACFVDKTHNEAFWSTEVLPLLKKTGTFKFAATITKTSSIYLGITCPAWAELIDEALCYKLINDILNLGNFGRADKTRSISGKMITDRDSNTLKNNKVTYMKNKFSSFLKQAKANAKHKVMIPFILLYIFVKSALLMLFGKKVSIFKTTIYAKERESLYKQFDLYNTK